MLLGRSNRRPVKVYLRILPVVGVYKNNMRWEESNNPAFKTCVTIVFCNLSEQVISEFVDQCALF